jgi:hypothetical protein
MVATPEHRSNSGDAADCILRAGARRALPTRGISERLASSSWDIAEPPGEASKWVEELAAAADAFKVRVAAARGLSEVAVVQACPGMRSPVLANKCSVTAPIIAQKLLDSWAQDIAP